MKANIDLIIFLLSFFNLYPRTHQVSRCKHSEVCIPLSRCSGFQKYIQPGPHNYIKLVRKQICGFLSEGKALVCCPNTPSKLVKSLKTMKYTKPPRKSLLPQYCGNPMIQNKIFGGAPTQIGAYPWIVALGYTERNKVGFSYDCAGSIISERYILTAAHCVHRSYLGRRKLEVANLGVWNITSNLDCKNEFTCFRHKMLGIEGVVTHPQFDQEQELANDIALIRLNETLKFDSNDDLLIAPVCLPPSDMNVRSSLDGRKAIAAGWGMTAFEKFTIILTSVEIPIVNNKHCSDLYKSRFSSKQQICGGGIRGEDTCGGDSGGPLVLLDRERPVHTQVGIVSFGRSPCGSNSHGVYTSVARYRNWIERNLKP